MNKKEIEAFVNYGFNSNSDVKALNKMNLGISIFYIIGIVYGMFLGLLGQILSIIMIADVIFFSILLLFKTRKNSVANIMLVMALISLEATMNFTLLALILCSMLKESIMIYFLVAITPIVTFLIYFCLTVSQIKNDKFSNKKKIKKDKLYSYSMIGGIAGLFIARIALDDVSQTKALQISIICVMFIAVCFSFGIINFLKFFYVSKNLTEK